MGSFIIFSKNGRDLVLFKNEHDGEVEAILLLNNRRICNIQRREDAIIAELAHATSRD